jgi:hypothetical protein
MVMRQTNGIAKDDVSALEQLAQGLKSHVDTVQQQACLDFLSSRHVRALWPRDRDVKHPAGAEWRCRRFTQGTVPQLCSR